MNILFLVTSFLLIFSFLSASLLKNSLFFSHEKNSFCLYIESKQKLHDKWERYQYKAHKKAKSSDKKEKETPTTKQIGPYESHRQRKNLPKLAKWNIIPLLETSPSKEHLEEGAAFLLEELYGHTAFWKKAKLITPNLAEALITSFKKNKQDELKTLSDLFPEENALQEAFYKMLKGSSLYNIEKKEGYPPLSEFFTIDTKDPKTLSFPYASYESIKALFGEDIAGQILLLEKEQAKKKEVRYYAASKDELSALLTQKGKGLFLVEVEESLSFSHKKALLEKLTQQEKKGPTLQIPLPQK